ncbi:hypothetical protein Hanom_Chr16g01484691 [Helianthus anomalus]
MLWVTHWRYRATGSQSSRRSLKNEGGEGFEVGFLQESAEEEVEKEVKKIRERGRGEEDEWWGFSLKM